MPAVNKSAIHFFLFVLTGFSFFSCNTIDLFERAESVPKQEWRSSYKPSFSFVIKDTVSTYLVYIILRHTDKYNYNNLWVNLNTVDPDQKQTKVQYELPLANNNSGWLATAMDDIYEHRISLTPQNQGLSFKKPGTYTFTLEHIMREDPLEHVLDVGMRIEKKPANE